MPDYIADRKSLSNELIAAHNRVRNFARQWPEDGRYKEIILQDVLARYLPRTTSIGTGFIIGENDLLSKQIDIIVYNNAFPPLFHQRDFVIVEKESILGIVEVKSKIHRDKVNKIIETAHENGRLVGKHIFNGVFGYGTYPSLAKESRPFAETDWSQSWKTKTDDALKLHNGYVNHICFGKDLFVRHWDAGRPVGCDNPPPQCPHYSFYEINDLAFGYFISNLVESVQTQLSGKPISEIRYRSLFPVAKETYRFHDLLINSEE